MRARAGIVLLALWGGMLWGGTTLAVFAQPTSVRVSAEVSSSEIGAQESVILTVRVQGPQLNGVETPDPPVTTNLVLEQSTPSTQRNVSITDQGQMRRSVAYRWTYRPMRTGSARVGPVDVTVSGTTYTTDEIRLTVVPQPQRPSLPSVAPHGGAPSTGGPSSPRPADRFDARDLFIRAEPSDTRVYQNEQVSLEYRLFFRPNVQLRHSRLASAWDANGFWREELDVASHPRPRSRIVDGRSYRSIVLKRVAVFPTRSGTLHIDPLRIETEAYATGHRQTLGRGFKPVTIASDPVTIEAQSLPPGAPPSFQGAVGQYTLDVRLSTDSVQVGDAVRMRATVQGTGNLATLSPPAFTPPSDFETFDPQETTDINRSARLVRGAKTFTYTLIPQTNGRYTIPPVRLITFDPETRTYETLASAPQTLHVTGDAAPTAVSTTGAGLPVGDIAPLMTESHWVRTSTPPLHRRAWVYVALFGTVLLGLGGIVYRRGGIGAGIGLLGSTDEIAADVPPAVATAERHLGAARQHLRNGETKAFYREIERSLLGFLRERTGEAVNGMSREALDTHLTSRRVAPADRRGLRELLAACEEAQFTPEPPTYDAASQTLARTRRLLRRLDGALPEST